MFGYWPSFIPDTNDAMTVTTKLTLFTVILKDPSHKASAFFSTELLICCCFSRLVMHFHVLCFFLLSALLPLTLLLL